jgi:hypothetical protein
VWDVGLFVIIVLVDCVLLAIHCVIHAHDPSPIDDSVKIHVVCVRLFVYGVYKFKNDRRFEIPVSSDPIFKIGLMRPPCSFIENASMFSSKRKSCCAF